MSGRARPPAKTGVRRLSDRRWLLGLGALLAAAGTSAAIAMRRRYASATADAKDATEPDASEQAAADAADDPAAEASSVNGRVSTPGSVTAHRAGAASRPDAAPVRA